MKDLRYCSYFGVPDDVIEIWRHYDTEEQRIMAMFQFLTRTKYEFDITPVVFVRYDEGLYRALCRHKMKGSIRTCFI